ncbi:hypothetical protein [Streptomyces atacamensis]|uniref:hypothetical protein n=1 Tax=Streptomyces atacamensis TaxID=531966 RepID=UPI00399CDCD9
MSAEHSVPSGPDSEWIPRDTTRAEQPEEAFRENRQWVGRGNAFMSKVDGDAYFMTGAGLPDDAVTEHVSKPRLREGPYPADEVAGRLRAFVEPPSQPQARKTLDHRILLFRAEDGAGAGTAAFALLAERHGTGGITGLDPAEDPARWRPKGGRGYLLQGLSQQAADSLGDVALRGLADLLRRAGAHLVVTVGMEVRLPADTLSWQVTHLPPPPYNVAAGHLRRMAGEGELNGGQLSAALRHLASREFTDHMRTHPFPRDGVELAEELGRAVVSERPAASVLEDLRLGGDAAAGTALEKVRHSADAVSLIAAVALLHCQDRTAVGGLAAELRPLLDERAGAAPTAERPDVLGPSFEERLKAVGASTLPRKPGGGRRYRYWVQPVVFSGRHRPRALLRRLWLEHEGMSELLWRALDALPYQPGVDMAAGRAIGDVLAHATGPGALRRLEPFAESGKRWQRRLVAIALGEVAQYAGLGGAVQGQLRLWSGRRAENIRCTVAETCASSYGLARPAAALGLLDEILGGSEKDEVRSLRAAVSFALSVLLTEEPNHAPVLGKAAEWLASEQGTLRHAFAAEMVCDMAVSTFPRPGRSGPRKVSLADVMGTHPRQALVLVALALDTPATYEAVAQGLLAIEDDPGLRHRAAFPSFLSELSDAAREQRGFKRLMLHRHLNRTTLQQERTAS